MGRDSRGSRGDFYVALVAGRRAAGRDLSAACSCLDDYVAMFDGPVSAILLSATGFVLSVEELCSTCHVVAGEKRDLCISQAQIDQ